MSDCNTREEWAVATLVLFPGPGRGRTTPEKSSKNWERASRSASGQAGLA